MLRYGPHKIRVEFADLDDADYRGLCLASKLVIKLDKGLAGTVLDETLIHECCHMISNVNLLDLTETQTRILALGLVQMLGPALDTRKVLR